MGTAPYVIATAMIIVAAVVIVIGVAAYFDLRK